MKEELTVRLQSLAMKVSRPFCYGCYEDAPAGRCGKCRSDDLMRHLPGVGCEYGTDWIIPELLRDLEPENLEERFEQSIRDCYPEETKMGWLTLDTVSAIKELDPVSWRLAKGEWVDQEENEEIIVSFDNGETYYDAWRVEKFLSDKESEFTPVTA